MIDVITVALLHIRNIDYGTWVVNCMRCRVTESNSEQIVTSRFTGKQGSTGTSMRAIVQLLLNILSESITKKYIYT
jgi:hypothetical protein